MSNRIRYILLLIISLLTAPYRWWLRRRLRHGGVSRVLVIRPDHLGDLLFASAALRRLRAGLPGAQIVLAVGPWGAALAERYATNYDALLTISFPGFTRQAKGGLLTPYRTLWRETGRLRRWQRAHGRIDLAINLRFDFWWGGLLCLFSGIPSLGYDTLLLRRFASVKLPYQPGRHEVEQNLALVEFVTYRWGKPLDTPTDPFFPLTDGERDWAAAWLAEAGWHEGERLLVIHPGAGDPAKQWPAERWAAVALLLLKVTPGWLLLTGSDREGQLCAAIANAQPESLRHRTLNVAGRTNLGQLAALLDRAALVMGVDSGPLHLASTLGRPTLRLFGPSDAKIWGPWPPAANQHRVIAAPHIADISVAQVVQTAETMLAGANLIEKNFPLRMSSGYARLFADGFEAGAGGVAQLLHLSLVGNAVTMPRERQRLMETEKVKVLIVDDDPTIRQLCADVLSDEGYVVDTASNGQEALARLEHSGVKVALIDIMMPIMDGIQLCRILRSREDTRHLPIIVMSAATNLANRATEAMANSVLVKPFEIDKLLASVEQLVTPS